MYVYVHAKVGTDVNIDNDIEVIVDFDTRVDNGVDVDVDANFDRRRHRLRE